MEELLGLKVYTEKYVASYAIAFIIAGVISILFKDELAKLLLTQKL